MECPGCSRKVPISRERCLYCGTPVRHDLVPGHQEKKGKGPSAAREREDRIVAASETTGGNRIYFSLDHLPDPLRKKVEQALRDEGSESAGKEKGGDAADPKIAETFLDAKARLNLPPGFRSMEEYIEQRLALLRSERKPPADKTLLTLILFASMALGGLIVWCLR